MFMVCVYESLEHFSGCMMEAVPAGLISLSNVAKRLQIKTQLQLLNAVKYLIVGQSSHQVM